MLREAHPDDLDDVRRLLSPDYPNLAFVHAVMDGAIPGRVWVSGTEQAAALVTTESSFCFAAGDVSLPFFTQAASLLATAEAVQLVLPRTSDAADLAARAGFGLTSRLQYSQPDSPWTSPEVLVPSGFDLVRIDAGVFASLTSPMARSIFGQPARYAEHAVGFALRQGGQVVADAHGVIGGGLIELGAFTHPRYRRQGLTRPVLAAVVRWGADHGLKIVTSFDADKPASVAISKGLGLTEDFPYRVAVA